METNKDNKDSHEQPVKMKVYQKENKIIKAPERESFKYEFFAFSVPPYHLNNFEEDDALAGYAVLFKNGEYQLIGYLVEFEEEILTFCSPEYLNEGFDLNGMRHESFSSLLTVKGIIAGEDKDSLTQYSNLLEKVTEEESTELIDSFLYHIEDLPYITDKMDDVLDEKELEGWKVSGLRVMTFEEDYEPEIITMLGI